MERQLSVFVAAKHGADAAKVSCRGGVFREGPRSLAPFAEAAAQYLSEKGPLEIIEQYSHPAGIEWDDDEFRGDAYPVYAWAATAVEVEVDLDTYETTLERVVTAQDIGKAIHPVLCEGQVEGGTVQALGYALLEEVHYKDGRVLNNRQLPSTRR
jgi:CO/xanthine dehydrogenase Mo-binding subunit